jgi:hypothetical protein
MQHSAKDGGNIRSTGPGDLKYEAPSSGEDVSKKASARYACAYSVARTITAVGWFIKVLGVVISIGIMSIGLLAQIDSPRGNTLIGCFVFGMVVGVPIFILGILISAVGQLMLAVMDTSVHTSPFLTVDQKATVMSLN